jgi:hypothetical protein
MRIVPPPVLPGDIIAGSCPTVDLAGPLAR